MRTLIALVRGLEKCGCFIIGMFIAITVFPIALLLEWGGDSRMADWLDKKAAEKME